MRLRWNAIIRDAPISEGTSFRVVPAWLERRSEVRAYKHDVVSFDHDQFLLESSVVSFDHDQFLLESSVVSFGHDQFLLESSVVLFDECVFLHAKSPSAGFAHIHSREIVISSISISEFGASATLGEPEFVVGTLIDVLVGSNGQPERQ